MYVSAKRERQRNLIRAGCLPPTYTLPRICFGKARTPKEARRAAPRLGFYRQDNDVHGGVPCVPPLCIVFLDFRSRSCFAPVVCLQHTRYRVYVSAKRERQRKVGQPVRPYVFIFKTTSFTNAPRLLCDVFLDFPSARLIAAERRYKVVRSAKRSLTSFICCAPLTHICCAPLTLAKGVRPKFPHLRDLFRPDARNFPRHHEAGFGDVRRIFAFYLAQICAVQISGVIIEKSRRSCCFPRSP